MSDLSNSSIPTAAFISYFVLEEALTKNVTIKNASQAVLPRFNQFGFEAFLPKELRLITLIYCLLVLPSEVWRRLDLLEVVLERAIVDPDLLPTNKRLLDKHAIRSIRNATAHARIYFENSNVRFVDQRGNAKPHFECVLTYREATNYLLVLGRAFHESQQVQDQLTKNTRPQ